MNDTHRPLRGLRSLALLATAVATTLLAPGCASADDAAEEPEAAADAEDAEQFEQAFTSCAKRSEPTVKVVSANIFEGGIWNDSDKGDRNWRTMENFVKLVRDINAPVLAVQETVSAESANRLLTRLNAVTGKTWAKQDTLGIPGWAVNTAIYWRTDVVSLVKNLGHHDLGKLESNGYTIRFHGALLEKKGTGKRFSVFTGKLPWTNEEENHEMAGVLRDRVRTTMAPYPKTVRIIAMDMNAPYGSSTWKLFNADYDDSGQKSATHPSSGLFSLRKRLDYIWVDRGDGPREGCAFLEPVRRSMHFGSDHRFVWGDVYLR